MSKWTVLGNICSGSVVFHTHTNTSTHVYTYTLFSLTRCTLLKVKQNIHVTQKQQAPTPISLQVLSLVWTLHSLPVAVKSPCADTFDLLWARLCTICFAWRLFCQTCCSYSLWCWRENIPIKIFTTKHIHTNHLGLFSNYWWNIIMHIFLNEI